MYMYVFINNVQKLCNRSCNTFLRGINEFLKMKIHALFMNIKIHYNKDIIYPLSHLYTHIYTLSTWSQDGNFWRMGHVEEGREVIGQNYNKIYVGRKIWHQLSYIKENENNTLIVINIICTAEVIKQLGAGESLYWHTNGKNTNYRDWPICIWDFVKIFLSEYRNLWHQ